MASATGTRPASPSRLRLAEVATLLALTVVFAVVALGFSLTKRAPHDDEGFFLYTLTLFTNRGHVYTNVLTLYGPAYHILMGGPVALLGGGHDGGRVLTALICAAISGLTGWICVRLGCSTVIAALAAVLAFIAATPLTNQPMQPSSLVLLTMMVALLVVSHEHLRPVTRGALLGACIAVIALTKINVGAFAAGAVLLALASQTPRRLSPIALAGLALGLVAPLGLLAADLGDPDVAVFAAADAVLVMAVFMVPRARVFALSAREFGGVIAGGAFASVVLVVIAMLMGEALPAMVHAVLFPGLTRAGSLGFRVTDTTVVLVAVIVATVAMIRARVGGHLAMALRAIAVVATLASGVLLVPAAVVPANGLVLLGLIAGPMLLLPRATPGGEGQTRCRHLLAALTVLEALQIYPISGDQISFALLPALISGVVCGADLLAQLPVRPSRAARQLTVTVLALFLIAPLSLGTSAWVAYAGAPSLPLAGSGLVHRPAGDAGPLAAVVAATRAAPCRALITYPGMLSFYSWTGLPAPAGIQLSDGVWWSLEPQLSTVLSQLPRTHRLCLIRNRGVERFWDFFGLGLGDSRLVASLEAQFSQVGTFGSYELWLQKGTT